MFDKRSARDYFDDDETKTLTWIEVVRFGHLDPRPGLLLQLRDGLPTFADDGAGYHWRHQHFEVVRRLHGCKAFIIYTVQIMRKYCVLKPQRLEYLLWTCNDCSNCKFILQFYSIVLFQDTKFHLKVEKVLWDRDVWSRFFTPNAVTVELSKSELYNRTIRIWYLVW